MSRSTKSAANTFVLETALTSLLLIGAFGYTPGGLGPFLLTAEAFRVATFAIFCT